MGVRDFLQPFDLSSVRIYSAVYLQQADTKPENNFIIKSVFKLVPHAFLLILVTGTWELLVWIPVRSGGAISGATPTFILSEVVPFVIGNIAVIIVFMLAESIAVFEPDRYGRAPLKQSCKYAKRRPGTIFCIVIFCKLMGESKNFALKRVAKAGLPVLVKIIAEILLGILSSVVSAYIALVGVMVDLVCKSYCEPVHTK